MTGSYAASFLPWILIPLTCWLFPLTVHGPTDIARIKSDY